VAAQVQFTSGPIPALAASIARFSTPAGKTFGAGLARAIFGAAQMLFRSRPEPRDRVMKMAVHRESQHARTK